MMHRKLARMGLTIAYPGVLGIPEPEIVTYQTIPVTYNGQTVTYQNPGEEVRP